MPSPLRHHESATALPAPVRSGLFALAGEFWALTKPRLSLLAVITAVVGYFAAEPSSDLGVFLALLVGTSLAAGACGALNQVMEREADARMARTRTRPLPAGSLPTEAALLFGLALAAGSLALLWFATNALATVLTLATVLSYLLVYTPMKQRSPWATLVGAFPGALPPLIGWAAASNSIGPLGWVLFGMLFAWQIPHFMAIAWNLRRDYARADMPMASVVDPTGRFCARCSLASTVALVGLSLLPVVLGAASWLLYLPLALWGAWFFLRPALDFARATADTRDKPARRLFLASIAYLPLVLSALVADRWLTPLILG